MRQEVAFSALCKHDESVFCFVLIEPFSFADSAAAGPKLKVAGRRTRVNFNDRTEG
jgi:hypothetical protein